MAVCGEGFTNSDSVALLCRSRAGWQAERRPAGLSYEEVLGNASPTGKHIIHLALSWQKAIETGLVASAEEIAELVGLSGGRVRQIVRLTRLHSKIIDHLKSLKGKAALKNPSVNKIHSIIVLPIEKQIPAFESKTGTWIKA